MKIIFKNVVFLLLIFWGCNDTSNEPQPIKNEYVKGDVSFRLKTSIDFQEMINTIFQLGEINAIKVNLNESSNVFPEDSLQYIKSVFSRYDFIDTSLTTYKFINDESRWDFYLWIRGFKEINISDWDTLKNHFNMIPDSDYKVYGLIKIEEGKESYWIDLLMGTNLFEWTDYNYIANICY